MKTLNEFMNEQLENTEFKKEYEKYNRKWMSYGQSWMQESLKILHKKNCLKEQE